MHPTALLFTELSQRILKDLTDRNCVSLTGLSNSGKSTLMRSLSTPASEAAYQEFCQRKGYLIYIDCNRAVSISAQAFYELVLRTVLERLEDLANPELITSLRRHYESVTEAASPFSASLSFNLALSDLCEQLEADVCLLFDEFDEIYASLDERALLNLRAIRDRFRERLVYVTATLRRLPILRGDAIEDEFAEMFSHFTYSMPLLELADAKRMLAWIDLAPLTPKQVELAHELSGGHPGLLMATAPVLARYGENLKGDITRTVGREPRPRAECLKIWNQLKQEEQESLATFTLDPDAGLPENQTRQLELLALLNQGQMFSPLFSEFVARKARGPEVRQEGVFLDSDSGDVWVEGIRIPVLTDLEYRLLALLYDRHDKLTDKYRIVTAVWGEEYLGEVDDARVEKLISRLRSKIEADPSNPRYLITQRGRGYKMLSVPKGD